VEDVSMTTLMLALIAGLGVGSDGMGRISEETQQYLCLNGEWECTVQRWRGENEVLDQYSLKFTAVTRKGKKAALIHTGFVWVDEGHGNFQVYRDETATLPGLLGIYKWEAGFLVVCTGVDGTRPTGFHSDKTHSLFTLKPAKSSGK
jgi:hypothetical protein